MNKPILLIMAAGMGSRYGGLKQMDSVGPGGELILDYSLFDARRAGFERAVIIIKRENEQDFRERLGDRVSKHMELRYAYQELSDLPEGYACPAERVKPWGTGHAVLCARELVDAPFCAINADDYYGVEAFKLCYDHLVSIASEGDLAMVGYLLKNTLSKTGYVARGVCDLSEQGKLMDLTECTHIISTVDGPLMTEDESVYTRLSPDTVVSMNMWGFPAGMMDRLKEGFPAFLDEAAARNPLKAEYFLPTAVDKLLRTGLAEVTVYTTPDKWFGVTYRADKPHVVTALQRMTEEGLYPTPLWQGRNSIE
ncbi:MAG: nucleotidyltransferase [Clostridia bacterium]